MKHILALLIAFPLFAAAQKPITYNTDVKTSNVHWLGKKTTGKHEGDVKLKSGQITFMQSMPVDAEFVLNMNSITVTDIKDAESNKDLVDHLKAEDFFGVEKHPTAILTITRFEKIQPKEGNESNYKAFGYLTIKDIKHEIEFPAKIEVAGNKATAKANITIDRTKWNVVYKSKSFYSSLGDKFIYDDITFTVDLDLKTGK